MENFAHVDQRGNFSIVGLVYNWQISHIQVLTVVRKSARLFDFGNFGLIPSRTQLYRGACVVYWWSYLVHLQEYLWVRRVRSASLRRAFSLKHTLLQLESSWSMFLSRSIRRERYRGGGEQGLRRLINLFVAPRLIQKRSCSLVVLEVTQFRLRPLFLLVPDSGDVWTN